MDMASWTIFSLLDKEFAAQIRLACVFGNLGNEALIVTKDDEVCVPPRYQIVPWKQSRAERLTAVSTTLRSNLL